MQRRAFISLLAGAGLLPLPALAQQRVFRIGLLDTGLGDSFAVPFLRKFEELGYADRAADNIRGGDQSEDRAGAGTWVPPSLLALADRVIQ